MLGQPLKVVAKLLELAVGHCRVLQKVEQADNGTHRAGVGPEGGRGGLVESCSSTPRKRTGCEDVADVVDDVAPRPAALASTSSRDPAAATPIDSCVANVARLLVREGGRRRGWLSRPGEDERGTRRSRRERKRKRAYALG